MQLRFSSTTICLFSALSLTAISQQPASSQAPAPDNVTNRQIEVNEQNVSPDDYLLSIGRKANMNIIADATNLPDQNAQISMNGKYPVSHLLEKLIRDRIVTSHHYNANTFLFWSPPDPVPIARSIAAGDGIKVVDEVLDKRTLAEAVKSYLRATQGWDGQSLEFAREIKLSDLPASLRSKLIAKAQDAVLHSPTLFSTPQKSAWLTDEFWKNASLRVSRHSHDKDAEEILSLISEVPGMGGSSMGITSLGPPPPDGARQ